MFCVSETEATAIRDTFERDGEFSAVIEFRRLSPGISDTAKARYWARVIAGWKPLKSSLGDTQTDCCSTNDGLAAS